MALPGVAEQQSRRTRRALVAAAVLACVLFTAGVSFHPGAGAFWTAFDDVGQSITPFVAALVCWQTARRSTGRERTGWALIGAGSAAWGVGQVIWTVFEVGLGHAPVSPTGSDIGFLLAPVLIVAGLLLFVDTPAGVLSRIRGLVEGLLIAGGVFVPIWTMLLSPVVAGSSDTVLNQLISLAYPVLDAVAISAVIFVATRGRSNRFGHLGVVAAGIVALSVADSSFWYLTTVKNYDSVNPTDAGWFIGFLVLAFGAAALRRRRPSNHDAGAPRVFERGRLSVALPEIVAITGLVVTAVDRLVVGRPSFDSSLCWGIVALAGLALCQGLSVVAENHALTNELEARVAERTKELGRRERHFTALIEHSSDTMAVIGADLVVRFVSDGMIETFGWSPDALIGRHLEDFGDLFGAITEAMAVTLEVPAQVQRVGWELVDRAGRARFAESTVTNLLSDPDVEGYVVNTRDVTDQTTLERQLRHQAFHDPLSGLANRALFNDRADHALARCQRAGTKVAIVLIDLDGFKDVNDSLGHQVGDQLLCAVADRLISTARAGDTVARLGGDEFVLLLEDLCSPAEAVSLAERLRSELRKTTIVAGANFQLTASIGVAIDMGPSGSVADLLRDADTAMYNAKNNGKDAVRVFEPSMHERARERFQLQSELKGAIDRGEFILCYQPSYTLQNGRLEGFEALVRWNHPTLGTVVPDRFIPLAEESGLIVPLGRWVLREAISQLATWSRLIPGMGDFAMAVNVSARQIRDAHLVADLRDTIATLGVAPGRIVLEVTESMLMQDPEEVVRVLHELKSTGVRIAIDDFGTGYSSLAYLQTLPVDILKVDKSFVSSGEEETEEGRRLLDAILHLGHTLGLRTVAEGVEQIEQASFLTMRGCDVGQGFLWAKPLSVALAEELLVALDARGLGAGEEQPARLQAVGAEPRY